MSIITRINKAEKRIVDLYNKLKNLPSGGGGVQSVTGDYVDNTDPLNPVLNVPPVKDSRPYRVYIALVTQSGKNAPVVTVLENTLGTTLVWSYNVQGVYFASAPMGSHIFSNPNKVAILPISNTDVIWDGTSLGLNYALVNDSNTIVVVSVKNGVGLQDGLLNYHVIEVRIYN